MAPRSQWPLSAHLKTHFLRRWRRLATSRRAQTPRQRRPQPQALKLNCLPAVPPTRRCLSSPTRCSSRPPRRPPRRRQSRSRPPAAATSTVKRYTKRARASHSCSRNCTLYAVPLCCILIDFIVHSVVDSSNYSCIPPPSSEAFPFLSTPKSMSRSNSFAYFY